MKRARQIWGPEKKVREFGQNGPNPYAKKEGGARDSLGREKGGLFPGEKEVSQWGPHQMRRVTSKGKGPEFGRGVGTILLPQREKTALEREEENLEKRKYIPGEKALLLRGGGWMPVSQIRGKGRNRYFPREGKGKT